MLDVLEDDLGVVAGGLASAGAVEIPQGQLRDILHGMVEDLTAWRNRVSGSNNNGSEMLKRLGAEVEARAANPDVLGEGLGSLLGHG